jgi:PadR family transcriptional regulator, regulatory protein PadR
MSETPIRMPSISSLEGLVIELLSEGERFGLELVDASDGRLKRGTVYVTLSRMETKGFVESRQEERPAGAIGLPRRMYKVTGYGLKVHAANRLLREALALKPAEAH